MSALAGQIRPRGLVLFNESLAGTNEREGSEIFLDHLPEGRAPVRREQGLQLAEKAPLLTSFGEDLYYRLGRWLEGDAAEFTRRPLPPGTATVMASVTVMAPER